jgi:hypothetical protein
MIDLAKEFIRLTFSASHGSKQRIVVEPTNMLIGVVICLDCLKNLNLTSIRKGRNDDDVVNAISSQAIA